MPRLRLLLATSSLLALAACGGGSHEISVSEDDRQLYLADKPPATHRLYERVLFEGERNAVLNHMRSGLAAMDAGALDQAATSFDEARVRIDTIYSDNAAAEEARSNFTEEGFKEFKGEGYERAMAYYYRGMLYMMDGDYENARASFKGGMLQDSFAEDQRYAADFASFAWLEGWSAQCMGRQATSAFAEVKKFRPSADIPHPDDNLLVIVESGTAPVKISTGEHGELLQYTRGTTQDRVGAVYAGYEALRPTVVEDLFWQASTRGGRQVDMINAGKAEFKEGTQTASDTALALAQGSTLGLQAMQNTGTFDMDTTLALGGLGLASSLAAGIFGGISANVKPAADIRYWDNLPDKIHLAATTVDVIPTSVRGQRHGKPNQDIAVHSNGRCGVAWSRTHSALNIADTAPNAVQSDG